MLRWAFQMHEWCNVNVIVSSQVLVLLVWREKNQRNKQRQNLFPAFLAILCSCWLWAASVESRFELLRTDLSASWTRLPDWWWFTVRLLAALLTRDPTHIIAPWTVGFRWSGRKPVSNYQKLCKTCVRTHVCFLFVEDVEPTSRLIVSINRFRETHQRTTCAVTGTTARSKLWDSFPLSKTAEVQKLPHTGHKIKRTFTLFIFFLFSLFTFQLVGWKLMPQTEILKINKFNVHMILIFDMNF